LYDVAQVTRAAETKEKAYLLDSIGSWRKWKGCFIKPEIDDSSSVVPRDIVMCLLKPMTVGGRAVESANFGNDSDSLGIENDDSDSRLRVVFLQF
jgi:hypothetical protein